MPRQPLATIDLTRDLPKVREQWDALMQALPAKKCFYAAPCVIGAMVPVELRAKLDRLADGDGVTEVLKQGWLAAPAKQRLDISRLQIAFDNGRLVEFESKLAEVEAKYLGKAA